MRPGIGLLLFSFSLLPSAHLAWSARDLPHLGMFHDDAIYAGAANNFATLNHYRIESLPWTPAQTKYPPLYPLYLSIAWRISPANWEPLAVFLNWLWVPILAWGSYRLLLQQGLPSPHAYLVALILPLHPTVMLASARLMSDLMFAALVVWSLLAIHSRWGALLPGLAFLTRTAGLPLLFIPAIQHALTRHWRQFALSFAGSTACLLGWVLWTKWNRFPAVGELELYYTDYLGYQLATMPASQIHTHLASQLIYFLASAARATLAIFGQTFALQLLSLLFVLLTAIGLLLLYRRQQLRAYIFNAGASLIVMCLWYYRIDDRALLPLLPLMLAALVTGLESCRSTSLLAWRKKGLNAAIAFLLLGALAVYPFFAIRHGLLTVYADGYQAVAQERQLNQSATEAYQWIRSNLNADTTFFAVNDSEFHIRTGRKALRWPILEDVYQSNASGQLTLSPLTVSTMRRYRTNCIFISAKHFPRLNSGQSRVLDFSPEDSGLTVVYQSRSETIACFAP